MGELSDSSSTDKLLNFSCRFNACSNFSLFSTYQIYVKIVRNERTKTMETKAKNN